MAAHSLHIASYMYELTVNESRGLLYPLTLSTSMLLPSERPAK